MAPAFNCSSNSSATPLDFDVLNFPFLRKRIFIYCMEFNQLASHLEKAMAEVNLRWNTPSLAISETTQDLSFTDTRKSSLRSLVLTLAVGLRYHETSTQISVLCWRQSIPSHGDHQLSEIETILGATTATKILNLAIIGLPNLLPNQYLNVTDKNVYYNLDRARKKCCLVVRDK